jgi:hypothetical protein
MGCTNRLSDNRDAVLTRPIAIFSLTTNFNDGYLTPQMKAAVCLPSHSREGEKKVDNGGYFCNKL